MHHTRLCLALVLISMLAGAAPANPGAGAPAPPTIKLLDAGSGAKRPLRYHFAKGAESSFKLTITMATTASMGGQAMPGQTMPGMVMVMGIKVLEVDAAGDAHCEFAYTDADVVEDPKAPKMMVDMIRKSLKALVGTGGAMVITDRGVAKSFEANLAPGADPLAAQQFENMKHNFSQYCTPLPVEAVGVGARWEVAQTISQQGMAIDQIVTMTLKAMKGDAMDLEFELAQSAAAQDIESPQMPGTKLHLRSLSSKGRGSAAAVLNAMFPSRSSTTVTSEAVMELAQMGELTQRTDMTMKGESAPAAPGASKPAPDRRAGEKPGS